MAHKPSTIFINPKFRNAHFNPNFLQGNNIHINPKFLSQNVISTSAAEPATVSSSQDSIKSATKNNPIIKNTRRTLIRASQPDSRTNVVSPMTSSALNVPAEKKSSPHQLIKINKNKLVTAAHLMKCQQKENEIIKNATESIITSKKLQRKTDIKESIYKLDRRQLSTQKKRKVIVSTYSLRRVETISPKKVEVTDRRLLKGGKPTPNSSSMININGVLYKSTSKKLEKTSLSSSLNPSERILVVRGENFILDSSGTKLKRDSVVNNLKLSRIDIGGLTYRASNGGDYERDNSHQVRSHLTLAKTKSISFLSPNALRKTSLICPIYRRIGKCLAYARGRCQKVHDQRYVIVCPNFVKGLCKNETCLLSHNANLHKMPVCKYFLEGHCQKQRECLYLHKKLTDDAKLCAEFLKGYCPLADKCNLLHDFPQASHRDEKFSIVRHKTNVRRTAADDRKAASEQVQDEPQVRYYIEEPTKASNENNADIPKRGALGFLPSFIPL